MAIEKLGKVNNETTGIPFTMISNELARNTSISAEARGIALYIASLPSDWSIALEHIYKVNGMGIKKGQRCVNELREAGYFESRRYYDKVKDRTVWEHVFRQIPPKDSEGSNTDRSLTDRSLTDRSQTAPYIKKDLTKKDLTKKDVYKEHAHENTDMTNDFQEMIGALTAVVKETFAIGMTETKFEQVADGLLRGGYSVEDVAAFAGWWKVNCYYTPPGKPALKTVLDEMANSLVVTEGKPTIQKFEFDEHGAY